jgi:hypothetical protein
MNTTIIDHTDANIMTAEQMDHLIFKHILAVGIDAQAAETKTLMDAMDNETALRFYGQVCGLNAMAWAESNMDCASLDFLIDIVAPLLEARGYVPEMQSGGGCY